MGGSRSDDKAHLFFTRPVLAGVSLCALLVGLFFVTPAFAVPNQLDGTIYWDKNNDGVQSVGEPGVPGVLVGYRNPRTTTVTDANGHYVMTGVSGTVRMDVYTGWYRSACNSLNCGVGTPGGNDFPVTNQFLTRTGINASTGGTFNAGIVPGWSGTYPIPSSNDGVPVDIAARLTYGQGCNEGTTNERLCKPGDTIRMRVNMMNQGTSDISNPVFALQAPLDHTIDDSSWFDNSEAVPGANTITTIEPFDPVKGYGIYRLNGTIPPGAGSAMFVNIIVGSGASGSPTPYPTNDPYDKKFYMQVVGMDQTGDPDTTFCLGASEDYAYGTCAINPYGQHDKTLAEDASDSSGWNVTGTPDGHADSASIALTDPVAPIAVCRETGSGENPATSLLTITNTSTGNTPVRNIEVVADVPSSLTFMPSDNPGWFIGTDGKPHTFINFFILPGASVDVPLKLRVKPGITAADNGSAALHIVSNITSYDTTVTDGSGEFVSGTNGTLTATGDVAVEDAGGCPAQGGSTPQDETLAPTGANMSAIGFVAILLIVLGGVVFVAARRQA